MKDPTLFAKLAITAVLLPVIGFVAVLGQIQGDGTYLTFALAGLSLLGLLWGPPVKKDKDE